jgi:SNF2 family DNA or RNA helicase
MIVLHAGWNEDRFLLWAEAVPETPVAVVARGGRKPRVPTAGLLPFDAGIERLRTALHDLQPDLKPTPELATLWLPTVSGQPVASSPLIAEPPDPAAQPILAAWTVTAVPLTPLQAIDLLVACLDRDTLTPGVVIGATLRFWATALRFASALVAREQFLPGIRQRGETWSARWMPTPAGVEGTRLCQLSQAMPPASRALGGTTDAAPDRPASAVLSDFLTETVDALVRFRGQTAVHVAPVRHRTPKACVRFDSIHDQWLHALRSPDGTLHGSASDLLQLAEQVSSWQRPVALSTSAPFRLCFRLEEPPADEAKASRGKKTGWTVRYLLQAQDDPSLLVEVAHAWTLRGSQAAVLKRGGFEPREFLLTALGQAAGLCPEIEASLRQAEPSNFSTDTVGAHRFLTQSAGLLEQAGFGVLLPAWWTGNGTKQKLSVTARTKSPQMQGGSGLTLEEIVKFDWQVALGEHVLTLRELEALARLKAPLVQVRGQWVQVGAAELQAALDFLKKKEEGQATVRELVRMAVGATPAPQGLELKDVEADGWVGDFLAQLRQQTFVELPAPTDFHGTLRPYQVRGYSWLTFLSDWGLGACLADDMGLGKTVQTLAMIQRSWEQGRWPTLLICPMSVVGNWKKEAERFTPQLPVLIHHGLKRMKGGSFAKEAAKHALVISSYALLHRDAALFEKLEWDGIVLDEAQNIKNPETKQAQAARALKGAYRVALTGTPVENHVGDLWSIWQFLNPGFLGSQSEFRRTFFVPIQLQRDAEATQRLHRLTGPFLLRRLKTDKAIIADLPDKLEMKVYCNLTKEQASLYAAVVEELDRVLPDEDGIQRKGMILGALSKLKQVCNHPAHFLGDHSPIPGRSGKLARLTEMLEEVLQAGERALVFTQFTEMGALMRKHLQDTFGREVLFLHGGVGQKQRDRLVERFQSAAGPPIFLLSLKAGGTGLNLTAANHVFHFDRWWNPAVENQATDRAFRIGQTRNVQVHKFLCVGTLEEKIDEMIERKQEIAAQVVGAGEGWLTELSNAQLKELLTLRQEALGE